jgi:hypothetical protein
MTMTEHRLDEPLLDKIVAKKNKPRKYIREQISKRAGKSGSSSSAVQIVMAMELGIGVAHRLKKVSPETRQEVQALLAVNGVDKRAASTREPKSPPKPKQSEPITAAAVRKLLRDDQLCGRCRDLVMA